MGNARTIVVLFTIVIILLLTLALGGVYIYIEKTSPEQAIVNVKEEPEESLLVSDIINVGASASTSVGANSDVLGITSNSLLEKSNSERLLSQESKVSSSDLSSTTKFLHTSKIQFGKNADYFLKLAHALQVEIENGSLIGRNDRTPQILRQLEAYIAQSKSSEDSVDKMEKSYVKINNLLISKAGISATQQQQINDREIVFNQVSTLLKQEGENIINIETLIDKKFILGALNVSNPKIVFIEDRTSSMARNQFLSGNAISIIGENFGTAYTYFSGKVYIDNKFSVNFSNGSRNSIDVTMPSISSGEHKLFIIGEDGRKSNTITVYVPTNNSIISAPSNVTIKINNIETSSAVLKYNAPFTISWQSTNTRENGCSMFGSYIPDINGNQIDEYNLPVNGSITALARSATMPDEMVLEIGIQCSTSNLSGTPVKKVMIQLVK